MTLRVGLDAHMIGSRETGNETYVLGLIDGFRTVEEDFELKVYHRTELDQNRSSRVRPRKLLASSPWIRLGLELPWRSVQDRIDVLHTTYTVPVWAACPVVVTVHDISYTQHPEWFARGHLSVLARTVPWSMRRAARVITVSELCRTQIVEHYRIAPEKVVCVHNAAGPAAQPIEKAEAQQLVSELGIDPQHTFVLAVGNLQPRKNLVRLIDAVGRVNASGVAADLVIVGPEHYRADLVREAANTMVDRIRFTGYLSHRQLAACYACATVFAFPSLFEGFGIPALEAMAHGTPVACARAGALPEVCGDAAFYFDPLDVPAMAAALKRLLEDPQLRAELAAAGRRRERQFTWHSAAEQTLDVYRAAADHAGRAPRNDLN